MGDINQSDLIKLLQRTGGESPDSFSISTEGGKCEEFFVIGGEYLDSWLADFVGFTQAYTTANPGDPRTGLARNLPIANGRRPYLFADSISSVKGIQYLSAEDWEYKNLKVPLANNNARLNVLNFPVYSSYREYEVGVTYSPRPYVLTNDEYIVWKSQQVADPANWDTDCDVTYYLPSYDGANNKFVTYTDIMPEWLRYTIHKKSPRAEFLTIDQGQGFLWNKGGANPLLPAGTGQVKNLYSSADVVITWMQVPYVFVDGDSTTEFKSMFDYALGTVNSYLFLGYNPGTLLFQAVNITNIYSQAFPPTSYLYDDALSKPNYYYKKNLVCDIEMSFIFKDPTPAKDYKTAGKFADPVYKNRIYNGHCLTPRSYDQKYYVYLTANGSTAGAGPKATTDPTVLYPSFPMQLLFTDPRQTLPQIQALL